MLKTNVTETVNYIKFCCSNLEKLMLINNACINYCKLEYKISFVLQHCQTWVKFKKQLQLVTSHHMVTKFNETPVVCFYTD